MLSRDALLELSTAPPPSWPSRLAQLLPKDPTAAAQTLLWLHAERCYLDEEHRPPSLGAIGDERYALTAKLDAGASAAVWQAHDRKLGRNVAIKVFHPGVPGLARSTERPVLAEARAACEVISDHVVRIHDVHGGARPYIVMELLGEHDPTHGRLVLGTAASSCRPRTIAELALWTAQVARGVHDAHLRNVFHRDLKPENVLITPISRRARITDFGLAVSTDERSSVRRRTGGIVIRGTPGYMAPEQARGMPELDPRSAQDRERLVAIDVWGIGALAYGLVAGRPPWHDASGQLDAWELAASGARPAPLERFVNGERVPASLRRIIDKALAMDGADRYTSAVQIADELDAFRAHLPTTHDRSPVVRSGLWCRRNPQLVVAGFVTIVLGVIMLGASSTMSRLRSERAELDAQVIAQRGESQQLTANVERVRGKLRATQQELDDKTAELASLEERLLREHSVREVRLASAREDLAAIRLRLVELTEALAAANQQGATRPVNRRPTLVADPLPTPTVAADDAERDRDRSTGSARGAAH